jgi:hypothetical protein
MINYAFTCKVRKRSKICLHVPVSDMWRVQYLAVHRHGKPVCHLHNYEDEIDNLFQGTSQPRLGSAVCGSDCRLFVASCTLSAPILYRKHTFIEEQDLLCLIRNKSENLYSKHQFWG